MLGVSKLIKQLGVKSANAGDAVVDDIQQMRSGSTQVPLSSSLASMVIAQPPSF